ncbi:MAG: hypothetical protein RLZZ618_3811 [Pseudomonadota bacterium]|jgi:hypothetical protein
MTWLKRLWRLVRPVVLALAAVILFIEEWGWRPLAAWLGRLARLPPVARLEALIRSCPPRVALLLFLAPAVALFPVKLMALWLIHHGQNTVGIAVIIVAKLAGTAIVGRLFVLTEPQLRTFPRFVKVLDWWVSTKLRVKNAVLQSAGWRLVRGMRSRIKLMLRRFVRSGRDST